MSEKPKYNTYRARKRPWHKLRSSQFEFRGGSSDQPAKSGPAADPRDRVPPPGSGDPRRRTSPGSSPRPARHRPPRPPRVPGRWARRRIIRYALMTTFGWLLLSLVLFLVSAQLQQGKISDAANSQLGGSNMLTSPGNVLVLGSDQRPKGSKEPGADTGNGRSDSIMLLRVGGGKSARLSILRDSYANIPGFGAQKINAAYALGGSSLAIDTVEQFLGGGLHINHVIVVDFENFPKLIDALGGVNITVKGRCVRSNFSGVHFALRRGDHHLSGAQALRYARVRKNACDPGEDDKDRARRQQEVLSAMKRRMLSPFTFVRLPWVAWQAPKAIVSDMSGPTLLAMFTSMTFSPSPKTRVLEPIGSGPGGSLIISEQTKAQAVRRFLK